MSYNRQLPLLIFDTMNAIEQWLNSERDYQEGFELFRKYSTDAFLIRLLSSGPDAYNTSKLKSELQLMAQQQNEQAAKVSQDKVRALMDERSALKAALHVLDSVEKRKRTAFKILSISDELTAIYSPKPELPTKAQEPEGEQSPVEMIIREKNLRSYVSKAKKRLITAKESKKAGVQAKIREYETELLHLTKKLEEYRGK